MARVNFRPTFRREAALRMLAGLATGLAVAGLAIALVIGASA